MSARPARHTRQSCHGHCAGGLRGPLLRSGSARAAPSRYAPVDERHRAAVRYLTDSDHPLVFIGPFTLVTSMKATQPSRTLLGAVDPRGWCRAHAHAQKLVVPEVHLSQDSCRRPGHPREERSSLVTRQLTSSVHFRTLHLLSNRRDHRKVAASLRVRGTWLLDECRI